MNSWGGMEGYEDIQVTSHAIYVVYWGVFIKEDIQAYQKAKDGKAICVFYWNNRLYIYLN